MGMTMRISLPGYNAGTDTNLDHYALYTDSDYVLIKTQSSGTLALNYGASQAISHGLGYIPAALVWGQDVNGNLIVSGANNIVQLSNEWLVNSTSSQVIITQGVNTGTFNCTYFIFYDKVL